ncbi:hypothetical protein CJF32_00005321 [Rutstroemia sp. NJR-2017a WRK4]|nr:hypothetical protein CJF32_00005321 [Rutstroemia sp. NJR-2017a WRK4]
MTQIKRIRHSIHPLTTILYTVEISKLSKELEAENYKNSAILLAPNQYSIYTDGSELINQKGIGIGLAFFNSNQELIQGSSWNIGTNTTPGIEASIAYISETKICTRKYYLARELVDD